MKLQRRPLQSGIRDSVLHAVVSGAIAPGQKIAIQPLADTLGVSATPVREALNSLVSEGVLEMLPGGSAIVPTTTRAALKEWLWLRHVIETQLLLRGLERKSKTESSQIIAFAATASRPKAELDFCIDVGASVIDRIIALADQPVLRMNLLRVRMRCGSSLYAALRRLGAKPAINFSSAVALALTAGNDADVCAAHDRYLAQVDAAALSSFEK